ncbi:MAG: hypothetical protein ACFCD0_02685 [Gemmataceae bacterium]
MSYSSSGPITSHRDASGNPLPEVTSHIRPPGGELKSRVIVLPVASATTGLSILSLAYVFLGSTFLETVNSDNLNALNPPSVFELFPEIASNALTR